MCAPCNVDGTNILKERVLTACAETDCWHFLLHGPQTGGGGGSPSPEETTTSFRNCSQTSLLQLRVCQDVNYDHFLCLNNCDFRDHAWKTEVCTMDNDRSDTSPVRTATAPWRLNLFSKLRSCMLVQTRKRLKWQQECRKIPVTVSINCSLNGAISASRTDHP